MELVFTKCSKSTVKNVMVVPTVNTISIKLDVSSAEEGLYVNTIKSVTIVLNVRVEPSVSIKNPSVPVWIVPISIVFTRQKLDIVPKVVLQHFVFMAKLKQIVENVMGTTFVNMEKIVTKIVPSAVHCLARVVI